MFNFLKKKIGIIGFGNMGQAIGDRNQYTHLFILLLPNEILPKLIYKNK